MVDSVNFEVAKTKVNGCWFNTSVDKFALIPDDDGSVDLEIGDFVDHACHLYKANRGVGPLAYEQLEKILELHSHGKILWPLGALLHQSALGKVSLVVFQRVVGEAREDLNAINTKAIEIPSQTRNYKRDVHAHNLSTVYWKFACSLILATQSISTIDDIEKQHLSYMSAAFRPSAQWQPWVSSWDRKTLTYFSDELSERNGDPTFGGSFQPNGIRRTTFGSRRTRAVGNNLLWFDASYDEFIAEQPYLQADRQSVAKNLVIDFFAKHPNLDATSANIAFSKANVKSILFFAQNWMSSDSTRLQATSKLRNYLDWIRDSTRDDEGAATVKVGITANALGSFKNKLNSSTSQSKNSEVAARPMPYIYHIKLLEIISEDNFAWPKSLINQSTGKPAHWFTNTTDEGHTELVFCEVLPRMLMMMLELPIRNVQIRRLDSGEGDQLRWTPNGGWVAKLLSPRGLLVSQRCEKSTSRSDPRVPRYVWGNKWAVDQFQQNARREGQL